MSNGPSGTGTTSMTWRHFWSHALGWPESMSARPSGCHRSAWRPTDGAKSIGASARRRYNGSAVGEVGGHDRGAGQRLRGRGSGITEDGANARRCATDDAAQPQVAEAVQRNGSQASAGAAPLEAPRAGLDSAGVAVALADRVIRHALARTNGLSVGPLGCDLAGDGDRGGVGLVEGARLDLDGHLVGHSQRMLAGPMFDAVPDQRDG